MEGGGRRKGEKERRQWAGFAFRPAAKLRIVVQSPFMPAVYAVDGGKNARSFYGIARYHSSPRKPAAISYFRDKNFTG